MWFQYLVLGFPRLGHMYRLHTNFIAHTLTSPIILHPSIPRRSSAMRLDRWRPYTCRPWVSPRWCSATRMTLWRPSRSITSATWTGNQCCAGSSLPRATGWRPAAMEEQQGGRGKGGVGEVCVEYVVCVHVFVSLVPPSLDEALG